MNIFNLSTFLFMSYDVKELVFIGGRMMMLLMYKLIKKISYIIGL